MYFQRYARGYGWGLSIRMPGDGQMLLRAAESAGQLGMTDLARVGAAACSVHLGPDQPRFHVETCVASVVWSPRVMLSLSRGLRLAVEV